MQLFLGDSREILKTFDENTFSSVVCDPPYGLVSIEERFGKEDSAPAQYGTDGAYSRLSKGFMGKTWDGNGIEKDPEFWKEVFRVMKPGAHLLAFSSPSTYHKMAVAIEEAGFEIRDMIEWIYGQGFPHGKDISKSIDSDEAKKWDGWNTHLKPAHEPICLARKPISEKTIVENILKWGTGGINVGDTAIEINGEIVPINKLEKWSGFGEHIKPDYVQEVNTKGRYPANLILGEEAAEDLDSSVPHSKSTANTRHNNQAETSGKGIYGKFNSKDTSGYEDEGGVSRFFYVAKANKKEKSVLIDGEMKSHVTSKPIKLMEYLIKLVNPPDGIVLDPFMGGGSTLVACKQLSVDAVGIELEKDSFEIAKIRVQNAKAE